MKRQWILIGMAVIVPLLVLAAGLSGLASTMGGVAMAQGPAPQGEVGAQAALGSSFTYQGQLMYNGAPISGTCAMTFTLYDAAGGGAQVGSPIVVSGVAVTGGLFTVGLDFGSAAFAGEARWLGVRVDCGAGGYADLGRQALTAAPYALYSASTGALRGRAVSAAAPSAGQVLKWNGSAWSPADAGAYWSLTGNAGTTPGANYLGTSDAVSLTLAVNGAPALRLVPNATSPNVVGGYRGNVVSPTAVGATIGGGGSSGYINAVTADYATIGGGRNNQASANFATVGGGGANRASGMYATVGGGNANQAVTGTYATVAGGYANRASADYAAVGGGESNTASGSDATVGGGKSNTASGDYAAVGGGESNTASGQNAAVGGGESNTANSTYATVGGGWTNTASGEYTAVGGGDFNTASGDFAAIAGGWGNTAGGWAAAVGGGQNNTANGDQSVVGGGENNLASGRFAAVGGGYNNWAAGTYAAIPDGFYNLAGGDYSFAAGRQAKANQAGCFVWGDSTNADVNCNVANAFVVRASGGVTMYTNAAMNVGAYLPAGQSAWTTLSDRALKANVVAVDNGDVLARLMRVPVSTWNYTSQDADASIRHMGPMAQDFYAAFGLGEDDKHISTLDADGVALAAIQGLYAENQALKAQNASQQAQIDDLQKRLAALEAAAGGGER